LLTSGLVNEVGFVKEYLSEKNQPD